MVLFSFALVACCAVFVVPFAQWQKIRVWYWVAFALVGAATAQQYRWTWLVAAFVNIIVFWPRHTITQRRRPYLTRWPLSGGDGIRRAPYPFDKKTKNCFLHIIRQSDGPAKHNHPYEWCSALILWGSYIQISRETPDGPDTVTLYKMGDVNRITADTFHTVQIRSRFVLTLFWTGKKTGKGWGFLTKDGFKFASGKGGNLRDMSYL